jgi:hypothetical protein
LKCGPDGSIPGTDGEELGLVVYKIRAEHFCREVKVKKENTEKNEETKRRMSSCGMWRCVDLVNRRFGGGSSLVDFSTLKMERFVPPIRRLTQDVHSATSQKTAFFVVTAVKTSNLIEENEIKKAGS